MRLLAVVALLLLGGATSDPYRVILVATSRAPEARGTARLVSAPSPFGVSVTADGVARYDVTLELTGLPDPGTLGEFTSFVAWATMPDLSSWHRLGVVRNGASTVGTVEINKFMLVITAESDSAAARRAGPTVLHGISPSSWLQSFLSHPLFKGIPPG